MASVNKVLLIGRLTWSPDLKLNFRNVPFVQATLVTKRSVNNQIKEYRHRLYFQGRWAQIIAQFGKKDSLIFVEGYLQTRSWRDKENVKRSVTEVRVTRLQLLDKKPVRKETAIVYNNHENDFSFEYPRFNLNLH